MSNDLNIPIRDKNTDIASEIARGKHFEKFLHQKSAEIAERVGLSDNLNEEIAQLAKKESLNQLQIQRFVEEVNTLSFNVRYKEKSNERDRRVVFELAELKKILNYMGDDAPGEVVNPNFPNGFIETSSPTENLDKVASTLHEFGKKENQITPEDKRAELEFMRKEASFAKKAYKEQIAKIGNVLIQSERRLKSGNVVFNTLIEDCGLNKKATDDIIKSVNGGLSLMKKAGYIPESFEFQLEVSPLEKKASSLFGNYSLLEKTASKSYDKPVIAPHEYAYDYDDLIKIANVLMEEHQKITKYMEVI